MRTLDEIILWVILTAVFWVGIVLIQPFKYTKTGTKVLNLIDNIELFKFELRVEGLREARQAWRKWHEK